ncbi:sigma-54 interaction domain-containing protein [Desulfosporosinus hippei]|uniref:HTH-type transcriptional regulatory protein TyrR n=1 Tax=Desulfosporosinus hippei DSM 8344 TaxID=1121419 RepID=A0A1G7VHP4_9FIRM|nr:sigma 54-interacting transcriptional regulator [Desulfosporosinus hippei]SDG59078.1 PAS domain S-box-containing protein [Desulfosporosinus hippei DSM 8344]
MGYESTESQKPEILMNELRAVLDSIYSGIIAVDINGKITYINETAKKFMVCGEEIIGRDVNELILLSRIKDVLHSAKPQYGVKLQIGDRTVLTNRTPIIINRQITGAVSSFLDITDLELVSHQIHSVQELNSELSALIDSSADGLVISDGQGCIIRMNKAYRLMLGIPLEENFTGEPVTELVTRGYLSELVTAKVLQTLNSATMVQEIKGREILFTGTPVFNTKGKVVRVIANIRDLTELNSLRRSLHKFSQEMDNYRSELSRLKIKALEDGFIFNSPEIRKVVELSIRVARVDTNVLITGESGVGKEIITRMIREASQRSTGPFIKINCGALSPSLIESELFGYEEGAFTGAAKKGKPGIFELAFNGTLFLDEVGELPLDLQVKLLRVIQEKEITRLGGTQSISVDVRLITATNRNLEQMVKEGTFRQDLFYRLNVVNIYVPPLRERVIDIPILVEYFMRKFSKKYNLNRKISPEIMQAFTEHDWPGNIRELENTIERMVILSPDEGIDPSLFKGNGSKETTAAPPPLRLLKDALAETEKKMILQAYHLTQSTRKAASMLGINQSTVVRKLKLYRKETLVMPRSITD